MNSQRSQCINKPFLRQQNNPIFGRKISYLDQFTKKFVLQNSRQRSSILGIQQNVNVLFHDEKWKVTEFQELKDELNTVKSQLNDLNLEKWHKHTNKTNIAQYVIGQIKHLIGPELLTQAWCKFSEIAATYDLIPLDALKTGCFNSVHLSEAPGAFITSLNHYLQSNDINLQWQWMASSLNPYYEENLLEEIINDDRFMMHTLPNWIFGDSLTGDLMSLENMLSIVSRVKAVLHNKIMLVTADGSVDCQLDPSEQEVHVAALKYCETITALHLLQPGGNFVLKLFTLFECETLCLVNLLCIAFEIVEFFKPIKSKGGNSEVYVVCLGYVGQMAMEPWLSVLRESYGRKITKKALFPRSLLQTEFLHLAYQCASYFMKQQIMVIQFNLRTFETFSKQNETMIEETCLRVAKEYIPFYRLRRIGLHQMLVGNETLKATHTACSGVRLHQGTFNDLQKKMKMEPTHNLKCLLKKVEELSGLWEYSNKIVHIQIKTNVIPKLQIQPGQPVQRVRQSRFCQRQILKLYHEMKALIKEISTCKNLSKSFPGHKVCDVTNYQWDANVSDAQRQSVLDISAAIIDLKDDESLCIIGLSLLTQFTVGLVFLLAHSFHHVVFVEPSSTDGSVVLLFVNFTKTTILSWLSELKDCLMKQIGRNEAVHSFVPVKFLAFYNCDFYKAVCDMNQSSLKIKMINAIKEELIKTTTSDQSNSK